MDKRPDFPTMEQGEKEDMTRERTIQAKPAVSGVG
jgi:hypothetical protein